MTLGELREALERLDLPADTLVVIAKDAEGNAYSPAQEVEEYFYLAESSWSGETYALDTPEDDLPDDCERAVLLWPTN